MIGSQQSISFPFLPVHFRDRINNVGLSRKHVRDDRSQLARTEDLLVGKRQVPLSGAVQGT